jgi:hypothetical protein
MENLANTKTADIFEIIVPGFKGKIVYVSQKKQNIENLTMYEVKLDIREHAVTIRNADKRKKKQLPAIVSKLFVANCVNLATRVCIDIMKTLSKKIAENGAYVLDFIMRSMMHIWKSAAPCNLTPLKPFNFIDSISKFGILVYKSDLESADLQAGVAFKGNMRQNFVVLDEVADAGMGAGASTGSRRPPEGRGGG